jgi:hypothetical protein
MLDPAGHSTLVSRACHFATWLLEADRFAVHNFVSEDSGTFPSILAAYLIAVADGNDRQSRSNFGDATLRGCLTAASAALSAHSRPKKPCSCLDPSTLADKRPKTTSPIFSAILHQDAAWKVPLPRKEPFAMAMVDALRAWLRD